MVVRVQLHDEWVVRFMVWPFPNPDPNLTLDRRQTRGGDFPARPPAGDAAAPRAAPGGGAAPWGLGMKPPPAGKHATASLGGGGRGGRAAALALPGKAAVLGTRERRSSLPGAAGVTGVASRTRILQRR